MLFAFEKVHYPGKDATIQAKDSVIQSKDAILDAKQNPLKPFRKLCRKGRIDYFDDQSVLRQSSVSKSNWLNHKRI